jgi:hypothetical protein
LIFLFILSASRGKFFILSSMLPEKHARPCAGPGALGIVVDPEWNNVRGKAVIPAQNSRVMVR